MFYYNSVLSCSFFVQREKKLILIHDEDLITEDLLVYVTEFVQSCNISHLFSDDDRTTIVNSIRPDLTQFGLQFSLETAWNFFLKYCSPPPHSLFYDMI